MEMGSSYNLVWSQSPWTKATNLSPSEERVVGQFVNNQDGPRLSYWGRGNHLDIA